MTVAGAGEVGALVPTTPMAEVEVLGGGVVVLCGERYTWEDGAFVEPARPCDVGRVIGPADNDCPEECDVVVEFPRSGKFNCWSDGLRLHTENEQTMIV